MFRCLMFAALLAVAAPALAAAADPPPQPSPVGTKKQEEAKAKAEAARAEAEAAKAEADKAAAEAAAKAGAQPQPDPEIERVVDGFFKGLQSGAVRKTYEGMWRGTPMDQKRPELDTIVTQTETALKAYGKIDGWEPMAEKTIAPSLRQHTYLVRAAVGPLFFRLELYRKPVAGWTIYRVDFADQVGRLP